MKEMFIFIGCAVAIGLFIQALGPSIEKYTGWGPFLIAVCTLYMLDRGKLLLKSLFKVDEDTRSRKPKKRGKKGGKAA